MRSRVGIALLVVIASTRPAAAAVALPVTFTPGALIIPMDVDYQDVGMLKAFGLLDKLLRAGVPVAWCIKTPKTVVDAANGRFEADFTASATDLKSGASIAQHGYRGGPFVVAAADAGAAMPIITAWQASNTTAVHVATASFVAPVSRRLTAAPRIAVLADGHESIAFGYLNAAGILDEDNHTWTLASRSVVTPSQVAGPTSTSHNDGALFRPSGQPAFCEIMTMHWSVTDALVPEVSAEMGEFLRFPVHLNAECQAVNAIEGAPPVGGRMKFVAPSGFVWPAPKQPAAVEYSNSSLPFAQQDGAFATVGGSEPAYALPPGTTYYDSGIVMVRALGEAPGTRDIWMTGYAGGDCKIGGEGCSSGRLGKVSYLGGHQYTVKTPMTANKTSQGTRLFLNSLYEAGCVTEEGQPVVTLSKSGPDTITTAQVTWSVEYANTGSGPALALVLTDTLPAGATFVAASDGGTFANGTVTWNIGDVPAFVSGVLTVTAQLGSFGSYVNRARGSYSVGLSSKTVTSNDATTLFMQAADAASADTGAAPDAGAADTVASMDAGSDSPGGCEAGCPAPQNPCQKALCVGSSCVVMNDDGKSCVSADKCSTGSTCQAGVCQGGSPVTCSAPSNQCQRATCDPQLGCRFVADREGQACDDGDACTTGTTCLQGECLGGTGVTCPQSPCPGATCDPASGCPAANACLADGGTSPADGGADGGGATMTAGDGGAAPGGTSDATAGAIADVGSAPGSGGDSGTGGPSGPFIDGAPAPGGTDALSSTSPDGGVDPGVSVAKKAGQSGCGCAVGDRARQPSGTSIALVLLGLALARSGVARMRRGARRRS